MKKLIDWFFAFMSFCINYPKTSNMIAAGILLFAIVLLGASTLNNIVFFGKPFLSHPINSFSLAYVISFPLFAWSIWVYLREMFIRLQLIDKSESTMTGLKRYSNLK